MKWTEQGKRVLLVRKETAPDDIHGMEVAQGVLTATGGMTSHAAVVGRQMGRPSVVGAGALYIDEKVVALVCDNQLFVKPTAAGRALLGTVTEGLPYPGAKPQLLITEQLEDQQLIVELMRATAGELPAPKPKAAKKAR